MEMEYDILKKRIEFLENEVSILKSKVSILQRDIQANTEEDVMCDWLTKFYNDILMSRLKQKYPSLTFRTWEELSSALAVEYTPKQYAYHRSSCIDVTASLSDSPDSDDNNDDNRNNDSNGNGNGNGNEVTTTCSLKNLCCDVTGLTLIDWDVCYTMKRSRNKRCHPKKTWSDTWSLVQNMPNSQKKRALENVLLVIRSSVGLLKDAKDKCNSKEVYRDRDRD